MKTDLENKVWYRLTKVAYIMFALLVLWVSVVSLVDEWWYTENTHVFSQKKVNEMRNEIESDIWIKAARYLEHNKYNISHESLKAYPYNINIATILWIYNAWYAISWAEIKQECYMYDNPYMENYDVDLEMKKFISWSTAILCQWWLHNKDLELWRAYANEITRSLQIIPYIDKFYNDPNNSDIDSISYMAIHSDWLARVLNTQKDKLNLWYFAWQIPMRIGIFLIEILILFIIIPRIFFYIALWKQH